tara:strand:- start:90 stop:1043 length:954 start_codon:yes stop_codon:yes gene_type:complete
MAEQNYTTLQVPQLQGKSLSDCRVIIIDDEESSRILLSSVIEEFAQCYALDDSREILHKCLELQPDLILLDVNMPGRNGLEICRELKQHRETSDIPVFFITGGLDPSLQDKCWEAGASDFIVKPVVASTLTHRVKNTLQNRLRFMLLSELTFRDPLTGVYNRYYLSTEIPLMLKHVIREQQCFGVIMIDIDLFKHFNDTYGHVAGDKCLQSVATALQHSIRRPQDCIIRYGGEEFVIFLPNTDRKGCELVGNQLLTTVRELNIENDKSPFEIVTISIGYVASQPGHDADIETLISEADLSLFEAKESGRNQLKGHCM